MENKTKGWMLIIFFAAYTIYISARYKEIIEYMSSANLGTSLLWYFILNMQYLLIIYGFYMLHENKFKGVIASFFVVIATNIVSAPRLPLTQIALTGSEVVLNIGTFFMKPLIDLGISWIISWWIIYVVIPIIMVYVALMILGYNLFNKKGGG